MGLKKKKAIENNTLSPMPDQPVKQGRKGRKQELLMEEQQQYDDEYYAADEAQTMDLASLKKAKKYKIIAIAFLIAVLAAIACYYLMFTQSVAGKQSSCWVYEQKIEYIASQYMIQNGFSSLPAYVEDLNSYESVKQECPSGGEYTWNPVTGTYSCSVHGHYPEGFNKVTSTTVGVVKTPVNSNSQ